MIPERINGSIRAAMVHLAVLANVLSPVISHAPAVALPQGGGSAVSSGLSQDAYILGPGDQVELLMLDPGAKAIGGTLDILNDGTASLALLGAVALQGLTINQATQKLRGLYLHYLINPELNLRVIRPRPLQVSVAGEVQRPGLYSLTFNEVSTTEGAPSTTISGLPTVVTAIQKAGGLTLDADLRSIRLQRRIPGVQHQLREARLNLLALLRDGDKTQNPFLFDGDTLVVGKAPVPDRQVMELAAANLSPQVIRVYVVGEVVKPGSLELRANTPVVQAILAAGGPLNWRARRSDVEIVRINRNGTATRQLVRINYSQGVSGTLNPPLMDGDTVVVNRSTYAVMSDALGAVASPLTGLVNIGALYRLIQDTRD